MAYFTHRVIYRICCEHMKQILLSETHKHTQNNYGQILKSVFLLYMPWVIGFSTFLLVLVFPSLIAFFLFLWMSKATLWEWSDPFKSPQVNVTSVNMGTLALSHTIQYTNNSKRNGGCGCISLAPLRSQLFYFTCWLNVAALWPWEMEASPRRNKKNILHRHRLKSYIKKHPSAKQFSMKAW